jgi:ABC-type multidrug transport system ATPase subunit
VITFNELQKVIGNNTVVDIPMLSVQEGEIAALVGPAGSGKEAILELLTGRTHPTMGSLRIAGMDPAQDRRQFSHRVGVLFAEDSLYKGLSPLANLEFHCRLYGLPKLRATEVLSKVGLADQAHAKVNKLPSGLLRRLALGRVIIHDPVVLLLVEPFARCDETTIELLSNVLRQRSGKGCTVLILAADSSHLDPLCDSIYQLVQGKDSRDLSPSRGASRTHAVQNPRPPGGQSRPVQSGGNFVRRCGGRAGLYCDRGEASANPVHSLGAGAAFGAQRFLPRPSQLPGQPAARQGSDPLYSQQLQLAAQRRSQHRNSPQQIFG